MKYLLLLLTLFAVSAVAGECIVSSADELAKLLEKVADDGACRTDSAAYREKYDDYRGNAYKFHVVRFDSSASFSVSLACMQGHDGMPLILFADPSAHVVLEGKQRFCINGGDSNVIIDNIEFKSSDIEMSSSKNAFINSKLVGGTLKISGHSNMIVSSSVSMSKGDGILITGDNNRVLGSEIYNNAKNGIQIEAGGAQITESRVHDNAGDGAHIDSCSNDECADIRTALISKTEFSGNGAGAIIVEKWPMPQPMNLVSVATSTEWKITGNLDKLADPWQKINLDEVKIELFIKDGPFIVETSEIDHESRLFVFSLPKPLVIGGKEYSQPVFTATAVDYENNNTSPFSVPLELGEQDDFDGDGIKNDQEDYNHNGLVDFGETDPRNPDTDGDGLTDGEERYHTGKVGELADPTKLDPTNPDSDGDCLNDGLELAVIASSVHPEPVEGSISRNAADSMKAVLGNVAAGEEFSSYCKAILKNHNVITVTAGDADTTTTTDPTNSDSDNDGLSDGEEDWNFNGMRDVLETDPNLPDSDGDSFLDGQEGDTNKNGVLDEGETDALLRDTDGDGLTDDAEILRFGSKPNACDSDSDGLSDGIEGGAINPRSDKPECSGLQSAGTNFAAISMLSPTKVDSDGDGINDGDEDKNHNGWLDIDETDPTTIDTDGDGIHDGAETDLTGVDINQISNGKKCSPPKDANDVDCDGIPNARDADSDNDGCLDADEGIHTDKDMNGIPDVWEEKQADCSSKQGSNGSNAGGAATSSGGSGDAAAPLILNAAPFSSGGGNCSLVKTSGGNPANLLVFLTFISLLIYRICRGHKPLPYNNKNNKNS